MFEKDIVLLNELYTQKVVKENVGLGPNAESEVGLGSRQPTVINLPKKKCACEGEEGCTCEDENCEECRCGTSIEPESGFEGGSEDTGAFMAKQELFRIHKISAMLHDLLKDEENLEPWVFSKITTAQENLASIFAYKDYEKYRQKFNMDMNSLEENNEESLYAAIDKGSEKVISSLKNSLKKESLENLEKILFETIKVIEQKKL
jgi:hypothetical protein